MFTGSLYMRFLVNIYVIFHFHIFHPTPSSTSSLYISILFQPLEKYIFQAFSLNTKVENGVYIQGEVYAFNAFI